MDGAANTACDGQFEWCGGYYTQTDLVDAFCLLQTPHQEKKQPIPSQSNSECGTNGRYQHEELAELGAHRQQQSEAGDTGWGQHLDQTVHADQFESPWLPENWAVLGRPAESLLTGLQSAEYVPWVRDLAVSYVLHGLRYLWLHCPKLCCALPCHALLFVSSSGTTQLQ